MTLNFGIVSYHIIFTFFPNGFQARPKFPFNVPVKVKTFSELYHRNNLFFTQWHETTIFRKWKAKKSSRTALALLLTFFNFSVYYHAKLYTITGTHIQTRKLKAVSVFVLYPPFIDSIFRQANTPFTQNQQYPTPFYLSVLYYHGNP